MRQPALGRVAGETLELEPFLEVEEQHLDLLRRILGRDRVDQREEQVRLTLADGTADERVRRRRVLAPEPNRERLPVVPLADDHFDAVRARHVRGGREQPLSRHDGSSA